MWPFVSDGTQHDKVAIEGRLTLSPDHSRKPW